MSFFGAANICRVVMSVEVHEVLLPSSLPTIHGYVNFGTSSAKVIGLHVNKPTDALNSNFIGITTLHVSGSLSAHHQEFLAVHRLWYILCSCDDRLLPGVGRNRSSFLLW